MFINQKGSGQNNDAELLLSNVILWLETYELPSIHISVQLEHKVI